jgi:hypothetical protein
VKGTRSLTSTRPVERPRPPVAERESRIASRLREELGQATMIDEPNPPRRKFLAYPVGRDLMRKKVSFLPISAQTTTSRHFCLRYSHQTRIHTLSESILLCPACEHLAPSEVNLQLR